MTFIEFKKHLLDAEISLPKFCKLIKISEKNLLSYKHKEQVPNAVAVIVVCFVEMKKAGLDYSETVDKLALQIKSKKGGFASKKLTKEKID